MSAQRNFLVTIVTTALMLSCVPGNASDSAAAAGAAHELQMKWEQIKFTIPEGSAQTEKMNALGKEADRLGAEYPDQPAVLIWDGIVTSERASMANPFSALGLAKRARSILERAYRMNPTIMDSGAPASLGVLYYRVPGFPIGFGDKAKARRLLEQATQASPNGLDAWYFYGDFLFSEGEYAKASAAFHHALAIPVRTDRPLWDHTRRLVIQERLDDIKAKM